MKKYKQVSRKRIVRSVFFNASHYMDSPTCAAGEEVTHDRVKRYDELLVTIGCDCRFTVLLLLIRYCEAKEGKLRKDDTVLEIDLHYLSLHEVEVLGEPGQSSNFNFRLQPVITSDKVVDFECLLCESL